MQGSEGSKIEKRKGPSKCQGPKLMSGKVQIWPDFVYGKGSLSLHKLHHRVVFALRPGGCPL